MSDQSRKDTTLPDWLSQPSAFEPPRTRARLRDGTLKFAALPARLDVSPRPEAAIDRLLAGVATPLRLVGLLVCVGMVSAARNMAFVWIMLALTLACLATRPTPQLSAIVPVAVMAALVAALVTAPAVTLGLAPVSSVTRMAAKTLCTVTLTLGLACGVSWPRMAAGLTAARVPAAVVFVIDGALRGIAVLGRVATHLAEALALRAVGRDVGRDASVGGVLGMTFLRAADLAQAQAEAMDCRGFDGRPTVAPEQPSRLVSLAYAAGLGLLVVACCVLEQAMATGVA